MYGTCFDVTHRSTLEWSINPDVVLVKPTNNPSSTTISTTANTMPVSVTVKRILSLKSLRRARGGILPALLQQAAQHGIHHQLRALLQGSPLHPVVVRLRDVQRDHSMHSAPERLRNQIHVCQLVPKNARVHCLAHQVLQQRIRV